MREADKSDVVLKKRRRLQGGALLIDALISIFTLALGAAAYYSLFPTVQRSQEMASGEVRAVQIASRFIEHIQLLRARDISYATLSQLNLVDPNQTQAPYSFTHIPLDEGSQYSPATALNSGVGRVSWEPLEADSVRVNVEVEWRSASGRTRTIRTGTIVGGYR
jgi:hypothetical protein